MWMRSLRSLKHGNDALEEYDRGSKELVMLKRIITAVVAICVLLPVLIFSNTIIFPAAVSLVSMICIYEISKCMGIEKRLSVVLPIYGFAAASPILIRVLDSMVHYAMISFIVASLYLVYLFSLIIWSHGKLSFGNTLAVFTVSLYSIAALSAIVYIRDFGEIGKYLYLLIFIGAWVTDTFAYFTGYFLGKHKLIEDVSPKKTIEGSIGGTVFCALSFVVFGLVVDHWFGQNANVWFLVVCGVIISLISQIGDLIMSVIKRHFGIKDFGKIFPGHGGMLDRFDSILAVSLGLCAICLFMGLTGIQLI